SAARPARRRLERIWPERRPIDDAGRRVARETRVLGPSPSFPRPRKPRGKKLSMRRSARKPCQPSEIVVGDRWDRDGLGRRRRSASGLFALRDESEDAGHDLVDREAVRLDDDRARRNAKRGDLPASIALIAGADIGEHAVVGARPATRIELEEATSGSLLRRSVEVHLDVRVREDDRAHVAPVGHAALFAREGALHVDEHLAVLGNGGDAMHLARDARLLELSSHVDAGKDDSGSALVLDEADVEIVDDPAHELAILEASSLGEDPPRDRPIERSRVEVGKTQLLGDPTCDGAFPGARGTVDRDDHRGRSSRRRGASRWTSVPAGSTAWRRSARLRLPDRKPSRSIVTNAKPAARTPRTIASRIAESRISGSRSTGTSMRAISP